MSAYVDRDEYLFRTREQAGEFRDWVGAWLVAGAKHLPDPDGAEGRPIDEERRALGEAFRRSTP